VIKEFSSNPFDKNKEWFKDLMDCQTLEDARAIQTLILAGIRSQRLRITGSLSNDELVQISEFSRRLLFDEEGAAEAIEVLHYTILAMKANGLSIYTQLLNPQEINLIIGC
jgi:hypothetical protein